MQAPGVYEPIIDQIVQIASVTDFEDEQNKARFRNTLVRVFAALDDEVGKVLESRNLWKGRYLQAAGLVVSNDVALDSVGLNPRVYTLLKRANIYSYGDLINFVTESKVHNPRLSTCDTLRNIRQFGKGSYRNLVDTLRSKNLIQPEHAHLFEGDQ